MNRHLNRWTAGFLYLAFALVTAFSAEPALAQKVNINQASAEELEELPGVGPKLAGAIVKHRETHGAFTTVEDLAEVPGISSGLIEKLMAKVTVGGAAGGSVVVEEGEVVGEKVVNQVLAKFASEPSIREVQEAAILYTRSHPDIIDSWRLRARTNALMPEFRAKVNTNFDRDLRTRTNTDASEAVVRTTDDNNTLQLEVRATWDLDRVIFDRNELGVWREAVRMSNLRDRVVDEVTRRYYERRRLQVDLELSPPTELGDRVRKELRVQELSADLDAMTGGWFSEKLAAAGRDPY